MTIPIDFNLYSILSFITILHGYGYLLLTIFGFYYVILDKDIGVKQLMEMEKVK